MHIIYIEDDPTNIALVERVARMACDTLTTYTSAEDAALQIRVDDADLILMDIDFGAGMNGLELTQILRDRGVTTPIIAITAYDLQDYMQWAERAGSDQFVVKPVSVPHLLDIFDLYRPG
jgi:two-component system cell cycle response regulator DivK